jgi:hypothetical protein
LKNIGPNAYRSPATLQCRYMPGLLMTLELVDEAPDAAHSPDRSEQSV